MWPFRRKKSRAERLREEMNTTLADLGDRLDQMLASLEKKSPAVRAEVEEDLRKARKQLSRRAETLREQAAGKAKELQKEARPGGFMNLGRLRTQITGGDGHTGDELKERVSHVPEIAAGTLAALTAGLSQKVGTAPETVTGKLAQAPSNVGQAVSEAGAEVGGRLAAAREKGVQKIKWSFTHFWLMMLRMGVGLWWLENLRRKDVQGLTDRQALDIIQTSGQTEQHPFPGYQQFVQQNIVPRASLVARAATVGQVFAGLGLLTGIMKRRAALVGLVLNANYALMAWDNAKERDENLMMALAEMVILATDA
ncbi:MAG: DoxX family membrane protein [Ardenticatenaceae bacterium]|nr:DoxX family membrane protein [Ardenticatenaceae bacterium]